MRSSSEVFVPAEKNIGCWPQIIGLADGGLKDAEWELYGAMQKTESTVWLSTSIICIAG